MKGIIKRYHDGDIDVKYNNFDIEKIFESAIIIREASKKDIEEIKRIIEDYIKEYNLKDFEIYYSKSFDCFSITYNI